MPSRLAPSGTFSHGRTHLYRTAVCKRETSETNFLTTILRKFVHEADPNNGSVVHRSKFPNVLKCECDKSFRHGSTIAAIDAPNTNVQTREQEGYRYDSSFHIALGQRSAVCILSRMAEKRQHRFIAYSSGMSAHMDGWKLEESHRRHRRCAQHAIAHVLAFQ